MKAKLRTFALNYGEISVIAAVLVAAAIMYAVQFRGPLPVLLGVTALLGCVLPSYRMWDDLRHGSLRLNLITLAGILTAIVLHSYWAALVLALWLPVNRLLEQLVNHRLAEPLRLLAARAPQHAHILRGRKVIEASVSSIKVGDKLSILPGELVPVDAVILDGKGDFDELALTGRAAPIEKNAGDMILAGSFNTTSTITARAMYTSGGSQFARLLARGRGISPEQTPFVRLALRYGLIFTLTAFVIAGVAWYMSGQAMRFLDVLAVATPLPLLLGAPLAILQGQQAALRHGIVARSGRDFENLANPALMVFTTPGVLTMGTPKVNSVATYQGYKLREVLTMAASLLQNGTDPYHRAIQQAAVGKRLLPSKLKPVALEHGAAFQAIVQSHEWVAGRLPFLLTQHLVLPATFKKAGPTQPAFGLAVDGKLVGLITFADPLQPSTRPTMERLHHFGIGPLVLSSAESVTASRTLSRAAGMDEIWQEIYPADRLHHIERCDDGPLALVGNAQHDSAALTAADVGVAMGAQHTIAAFEVANVAIMQDDIAHLAAAVAIVRRSLRAAQTSILVGIGLSLGLMALFATGLISAIYGALAQEFIVLVALALALFPRSKPQS